MLSYFPPQIRAQADKSYLDGLHTLLDNNPRDLMEDMMGPKGLYAQCTWLPKGADVTKYMAEWNKNKENEYRAEKLRQLIQETVDKRTVHIKTDEDIAAVKKMHSGWLDERPDHERPKIRKFQCKPGESIKRWKNEA